MRYAKAPPIHGVLGANHDVCLTVYVDINTQADTHTHTHTHMLYWPGRYTPECQQGARRCSERVSCGVGREGLGSAWLPRKGFVGSLTHRERPQADQGMRGLHTCNAHAIHAFPHPHSSAWGPQVCETSTCQGARRRKVLDRVRCSKSGFRAQSHRRNRSALGSMQSLSLFATHMRSRLRFRHTRMSAGRASVFRASKLPRGEGRFRIRFVAT